MGGVSKDQVWQFAEYGEMGFGAVSETITITQNQWAVVTNGNNDLWSTAALQFNGVSYSNDTLIIDEAGKNLCNLQLSVDGSNGSIIRLGLYKNSSLACVCTGYQELANNKIIQLSYIDILNLNANDVLQVVITDTAGNSTPDAIAGKMTINKIAE